MKKNLFLIVCFFAIMSVANAQNEITITVNTESSVEFSLDERPIILSYASTVQREAVHVNGYRPVVPKPLVRPHTAGR